VPHSWHSLTAPRVGITDLRPREFVMASGWASRWPRASKGLGLWPRSAAVPLLLPSSVMRITPAGAFTELQQSTSERVVTKEDEAYHTRGSNLNVFHHMPPAKAWRPTNLAIPALPGLFTKCPSPEFVSPIAGRAIAFQNRGGFCFERAWLQLCGRRPLRKCPAFRAVLLLLRTSSFRDVRFILMKSRE